MVKPLLVIAGSSGVVGQHLINLAKARYDIRVLTRRINPDGRADVQQVSWNPKAAGENNEQSLQSIGNALSGAHAILNLSGSSIAAGKLDKKHQAEVLSSRLDSAATLLEALKRSQNPPAIWFQASAVGYYGHRKEEILDETSPPQTGYFLSDISVAWEDAAKPFEDFVFDKDARLLVGRIGIVLAKDASAWQKMLQPIKAWVGGPLGSGRQWYPWIEADDLARAILFLIENQGCQGAYNLTAPEAARQLELFRKAAKKLNRPGFTPAPALALKLLLGKNAAEALVLNSANVKPKRLLEAGFAFTYPTIDKALEKLL
ncbi:MAG: TIGR01777 family oxidoreductase [Trueperaceae bacterium]